jgi:hypothetical protein
MASLFERLDQEEAIVRGELDALREKAAVAEERLARLAITRETARQLLGDDAGVGPARADEPPAAQEGPGSASDSREASAGPAAEAAVEVGGPRRVEWAEGLELIASVLATDGRPMRVRQIAAAIGEDVTAASRIETTRGRCKKLVKDGTVVELAPGIFQIAPAAAPVVAAAGGEAPGMR